MSDLAFPSLSDYHWCAYLRPQHDLFSITSYLRMLPDLEMIHILSWLRSIWLLQTLNMPICYARWRPEPGRLVPGTQKRPVFPDQHQVCSTKSLFFKIRRQLGRWLHRVLQTCHKLAPHTLVFLTPGHSNLLKYFPWLQNVLVLARNQPRLYHYSILWHRLKARIVIEHLVQHYLLSTCTLSWFRSLFCCA